MTMKNTAPKRTLAYVISLALAASLTACAPMNSDTRRSDTESELLSEVFPETNAELRDDEENIETTVTAEEITETETETTFLSELSLSYYSISENGELKSFEFDGDHSKKIDIGNADSLIIDSFDLRLSDFNYCPSLEKLFIDKSSSNDLKGIENFPNITMLEIDQDTYISDISEIVKCKKIEDLTFHFANSVSDYSYLGELENLNDLYIILSGRYDEKDCKAVNIESLSSCKNLEYLGIQGCYMESMDFLEPLTNLKELRFWTTCPEPMDISPLSGMDKLEKLEITHYGSDDISVFLQMDNLKELDIHEQGYSQESIDKLNEAFSDRKIEIDNGHNI